MHPKGYSSSGSARRRRAPRWALLAVAGTLGAIVGLAPLVSGRSGPHPTTQQTASETSMNELKNEDGSWKHTNTLIESSSPYLLQHAHNPVDWREWGEKAFEIARREDKPILVSIGYSTCYWCHVMERQVFENPEIAEQMNRQFVCIKVDREQRPDVDEIYMLATQLQTQHGGWPNNVFLTPELKPFYAGTYFGPTDQHGRPGFPTLLDALHDAWVNRRDEVEKSARQFTDAIRELLGGQLQGADGEIPDKSVVEQTLAGIGQNFDPRHGGFGAAPKFPQETMLLFLLAHASPGSERMSMANTTLERMAMGGIFDQVGGGFARYSVDAQWHVPHFEKMLYNQALLTRVYTAAHVATGDPMQRRIAERTLEFVQREMTGPEGRFYSALDAESEDTEGKHYVWTEQQITEALGEKDASFLLEIYGLAPVPEIPGHKHPEGGVLHWKRPFSATAKELGLEPEQLHDRLQSLHAALLKTRQMRENPALDDKTIVGWNGLMIQALAYAGAMLDEPEYTRRAARAAHFILDTMRRSDGGFWRIHRQGDNEIDAFQEDYAFLAQGLLALHRATSDARWLTEARSVVSEMNKRFGDPDGAYFFTESQGELIARTKSPTEGAIPSGNAAAAHALLDLHELTGDAEPRKQARTVLDAFSGLMRRSAGGQIHMIHGLSRWLDQQASNDAASRPDDFIQRPSASDAPATPVAAGSAERVATAGLASVSAVRPGDRFRVAVMFDIEDGWHINAADPAPPNFVATAVEPLVDDPFEVVSIEYPDGEELRAAFAGEPLRVYEGRVFAFVELVVRDDWRPDPETDRLVSLRLAYTVQACSEDACLEPARGVEVIELPVVDKNAEVKRRHEDVFDGA